MTVLTPPGRGAVATIRVHGIPFIDRSPPLFAASNGRPLSEQPIGQVCFGHWGSEVSEHVVCVRVGPRVAEIHCHGGNAAVRRIVADIQNRLHHGDSPPVSSADAYQLVEGECLRALSQATTMRTADILWQQCDGRLAGALSRLKRLPPGECAATAEAMLEWSEFGLHLTQPWKVVVCGRPNVGKSSLINALVGYGRSLVFDQPGTTRDVVSVETALEGWPIELSDTAGIRDDADLLETVGISRAHRSLEAADLRIIVVDVSRPLQEHDRSLMARWPDAIVVAHKCDLPAARSDLPAGSLQVSSLTGYGIEVLASSIASRLIPQPPPTKTLLPVNARQVTLLRDVLLRCQ